MSAKRKRERTRSLAELSRRAREARFAIGTVAREHGEAFAAEFNRSRGDARSSVLEEVTRQAFERYDSHQSEHALAFVEAFDANVDPENRCIPTSDGGDLYAFVMGLLRAGKPASPHFAGIADVKIGDLFHNPVYPVVLMAIQRMRQSNQGALDLLEKCQERVPEPAGACALFHCARGLCQRKLAQDDSEYVAALASYDLGLGIIADWDNHCVACKERCDRALLEIELHRGKATVYRRLGDPKARLSYEKALEAFKHAREPAAGTVRHPSAPRRGRLEEVGADVYFSYGYWLFERCFSWIATATGGAPPADQLADAERAFRRSSELNPSFVAPRSRIALLDLWNGKLGEAAVGFATVTQGMPARSKGLEQDLESIWCRIAGWRLGDRPPTAEAKARLLEVANLRLVPTIERGPAYCHAFDMTVMLLAFRRHGRSVVDPDFLDVHRRLCACGGLTGHADPVTGTARPPPPPPPSRGARGVLRILHLSDLHGRARFQGMLPGRQATIEADETERGKVLGKRFEEALLAEVAERGVHLVCFTGDVADWGIEEEYVEATRQLDRIIELAHVPPQRFFAVPGNHDIRRRVSEEAWRGIRGWLAKNGHGGATALGHWFMYGGEAPSGAARAWREELLEREAQFWKWYGEFRGAPPRHAGAALLGYRETLPVGSIPDVTVPVHVIGLDSAWLCGADEKVDGGAVLKDQGSIVVTSEQVLVHARAGRNALEGFRLALVHHPLDHLADHHAVRHALADDVDLLLHGHQHAPLSMVADEPGARLRILAAGCLMEGDLGKDWPNAFHLVEVDVGSGAGAVHFRKWSPIGGFWAPGSDLYRDAPQGVLPWDARPAP